jgi:hypothetical protein
LRGPVMVDALKERGEWKRREENDNAIDTCFETGHIQRMTRARHKKKLQKDSIRCKLGYAGGPWTIEQAREMVIAALDELASVGITHITRANLYLNPVDEKGRTVTRIGRYPLPEIEVPHPYRSAADEHGV